MKRFLIAVLSLAPVAAADLKERRLHLSAVEASSFLFNDWNRFQENYHPLYLGDDDPVTAWVEGDKGPGVGQWVRLRVTEMKGASRVRVRVRNGYQKTAPLFAANGRIRGVTVTLLPSKVKVERELEDKQGWQEIIVEQPAGKLEAIELTVRSVYPGKKYEDLCLSDAQLYVTADSPDNPAFEKSRFEQILAWKRSRLEAAKAFKQASHQAMPLLPQYRVSESSEDAAAAACPKCSALAQNLATLAANTGGEKRRRALGLVELVKTLDKSFTAVQMVALDKRPIPTVDGLCTPDIDSCDFDRCHDALALPMVAQLGTLKADQLGLFDLKQGPGPSAVAAAEAPACKRRDLSDFAWVHRRPPGADGKARIDALILGRCGAVESREGFYPAGGVQLLAYDEEGLLEMEADENAAQTYQWERGVLVGGRILRSNGDKPFDVKRAAEVAQK